MDISCAVRELTGQVTLGRLLLLLLLTVCQPAMCWKEEQKDTDNQHQSLRVEIIGPGYVSVGVPCTIECTSSCSTCTHSMSLEGQKAQGRANRLTFTIDSWVKAVSVTCTATDEENGVSVAETKQLQVLVGPANVSISGANLMSRGVSHTYSCHARCQPSCNYTWKADEGPWFRGQGNVISVTPQKELSKTLSCRATNTISGLSVTVTRSIALITGPSDLQIKGPDVVEIGREYQFTCTSGCHPSCRYVSSVGSQAVRGNVIEITVDHPLAPLTLKCEAQNTASREAKTAFKTVHVAGSDRSLATCLQGTPVQLLVSFVLTGFVLS